MRLGYPLPQGSGRGGGEEDDYVDDENPTYPAHDNKNQWREQLKRHKPDNGAHHPCF